MLARPTSPRTAPSNLTHRPHPPFPCHPAAGSWFEGDDELLMPDVLAAGGAPVLARSGGD